MLTCIGTGSLLIILAATLWSMDGLLRRTLYTMPAANIVFLEHVLGTLILAPIIWKFRHTFRTIQKNDFIALLIVALLSGFAGTLLYTQALLFISFIPFSVVVLLQQLQPLFAILSAAILLKEPLGKRFWMLAVAAMVAAYFVSFPDLTVSFNTGEYTWLAAVLAGLAAAAWGTSTTFSKYTLNHLPVSVVTSVRFMATAVIAGVWTLIVHAGSTVLIPTGEQFLMLLAITGSTGMVALYLYYVGLRRVPVSRSTILELTWPLSAVIIGYVFFGEVLSVTQAIGAIVLVIIMLLVKRDAQQVTTT